MFKKVNTYLLIKIKWLNLIQTVSIFRVQNIEPRLIFKNVLKIKGLLKFIPKRLNIVNFMDSSAALKADLMAPFFGKEKTLSICNLYK